MLAASRAPPPTELQLDPLQGAPGVFVQPQLQELQER